ncbi:hypothetical protein [Leucobacter sp. OH1287]|uniref:hypothetical protein n=1 Tax=Leucobacter sp. OH1287 TaxID=2491049 RepID=UPI001F18738C|nr:hypothetical protein [Leucobacter sp. OH1287]
MTKALQTISTVMGKIGVKTAYAKPYQFSDTQLVPVAAVWSGWGGGDASGTVTADHDGEIVSTSKDHADADGVSQGGGGGTIIMPIGAYLERDGRTRFEPNTIALLSVAIPFVCVLGRAIARIVRVCKKKK